MNQKVPTLSGKWFKQREKLSAAHIKALVIPGPGPAAERKLSEMNWNTKVIGTITMELANDNRSVVNGQFGLHGTIANASITVPAKKIWEEANEAVSVSIKLPVGNKFNFPCGLTSEYLDESVLDPAIFFHNDQANNPVLEPGERETLKIDRFCLRAVVVPSTPSFVKLTILVFPGSKEEVLTHPLASNPAWPGIRLFDGQLPLFPPSSVKNLQWGQPFLPLFVLGTPWELADNVPPHEEVLAKFAGIMRSCAMPNTCRNAQVLASKWEELDESGASRLSKTKLEKTWPAPPPSPLQQEHPG